eukprot:scaffold1615_cov183-Skeletonema_menzelii.AAC.1
MPTTTPQQCVEKATSTRGEMADHDHATMMRMPNASTSMWLTSFDNADIQSALSSNSHYSHSV